MSTRAAKKEVVRDDWDEPSDNEEERATPEQNVKLWEAANKAPAPMPTVVMSSSSSVVLQAAFEPKMKILKRPQNTTASSTSGQSSNTSADLKEREARYQAARDRIFGSDSTAAAEAGDSAE